MVSARPPFDPPELRAFPQADPPIGPGRPELFRIFRHRDEETVAVRGPFYFVSAGDVARDNAGRYGLPAPDGTCYLAFSFAGAWLEVFRTTGIVAASDLRRRRLLRTRPPRRVRTADLTAKMARRFGITGEIHTTREYSLTRAWAQRLRDAGFRAVLGKVRHDPGLRERSLTLFDTAGEHEPYRWRWRKEIARLDQMNDALTEVERYGFRVLERPVDVITDEFDE